MTKNETHRLTTQPRKRDLRGRPVGQMVEAHLVDLVTGEETYFGCFCNQRLAQQAFHRHTYLNA